MGFINILSLLALLLGLLDARNAQAERDKFPCGYDYSTTANAWFKMHDNPRAYWEEARFNCYAEGASLATPSSDAIKKVMMSLMKSMMVTESNKTLNMLVHTGYRRAALSGRDDNGVDMTSVALTDTGELIHVSRYVALPYICYKKAPQKLQLSLCGTTDPEYFMQQEIYSCYKFHNNPAIWSVAAQICADEGGYLAIINNKKEANQFANYVATNPSYKIHGHWLDLSQNFAHVGYWADDNKEWRTIKGQNISELQYDDWAPGEPKNSRTYNELCGTIGHLGKLFANNCIRKLGFICERDIRDCHSC